MIKKTKNLKHLLVLSAAMLLPVLSSCNKASSVNEFDLQILATSDLHGKFLPFDYMGNKESKAGSVAQIATKVNELRNENSSTLVFDNGDALQDNLSEIFTASSWLDSHNHPMIDAMNLVKYDGLGLGNHEFNYGVPTLEKIYSKANAEVICGNVFNSEDKLIGKAIPHKIYEVNGAKIGVIGAVTPNIVRWDAANLENYKVKDPAETVKSSVDELKDKTDVLILLAHMGENNEYEVKNSGITDISKACPELDLIVAGHDHKKTTGTTAEGTPYIENSNQGQTIGKVNFQMKKENGKWTIVDTKLESLDMSTVEASDEFKTKLKDANDYAIKDATTVIAKYNGDQDLQPESDIKGIATGKIQPTLITQLINQVQTDQVKKYIASKGDEVSSTGTKYSEYKNMRTISATGLFVESANVKVDSDIRKCDVSNIYSYTNTLYAVEMNGAQLKKYLEWCGAYYNKVTTNDLTISFNKDMRGYLLDMFTGIDYQLNLSKDLGSRVENLKWSDTKTVVNDTDKFVLAVNNYRATTQLLTKAGKDNDFASGVFKGNDEVAKLIDLDVYGDGVREQIMKHIKEKASANNGNFSIDGGLINNWSLTGIGSNKNGWTSDDLAKREQIKQGIASNKICVVHGGGVVDGNYQYLGLDTVTTDYKNTYTAVSADKYNSARYTNVRSITKDDVTRYLS